MKYILLSVFILLQSPLFAQEGRPSDSLGRKQNKAIIYYGETQKPSKAEIVAKTEQPKAKGKLVVIEEDSLNLLMEGYKDQKQIEGYKIQLYSGRSRMDAVKVKSSFHSKFGESESADIVYQQPNFKIRVGNYRNRLAANKWLQIYKIDFPSSFIVKDIIKIDHKN